MLKRIILGLLLLVVISIAGVALWYFNRSLPDAIHQQPIFEGIEYWRIVDKDTPLVYHVISIDLTQPDIRFFATPADDIAGFDYAARTTSGFLDEYDLQVAINGISSTPGFRMPPGIIIRKWVMV